MKKTDFPVALEYSWNSGSRIRPDYMPDINEHDDRYFPGAAGHHIFTLPLVQDVGIVLTELRQNSNVDLGELNEITNEFYTRIAQIKHEGSLVPLGENEGIIDLVQKTNEQINQLIESLPMIDGEVE